MSVITLSALRPLLAAEGLDCAALAPLTACRITREYLLTRAGLDAASGSVIMLALPYRAPGEEKVNLSRYAIPPDYHHIAAELFARLIPRLEARWPGAKFAGFADHSPIDERHAAAISGLGIIGDHGLIITERYASYIFLAELITDLPTDAEPLKPQACTHCGACRAACPVGLDWSRCLSALTQKKGALTDAEAATIRAHGSAWGCDLCQEACPHTGHADFSPLPAFLADRIPYLTAAQIEAMNDDAFARRAYAWRGRAVILRNLRLLEEKTHVPQ